MKLLRRLMAFVYRRSVQLVLSVLTTIVVGGLLVFTIQFTLFDPRWLMNPAKVFPLEGRIAA